jgi:hypothetical protein
MPGAYAHITLVNHLREPARLERIPGLSREIIPSVLDYFKYCELGAVSPDYPYLAVGGGGAAEWADAMHYENTVEMIHSGISHIKAIKDGGARSKCTAWLLGYAAHVTADVTIHPIVQLKVGPYEENKKGHRVCEMNQDAHIFQRLNLGDIGVSEHLDTGICACGSKGGDLDSDIEGIWTSMLSAVYPSKFRSNPPDLGRWHKGFKLVVDNFAEEGGRLPALARHVAANAGLTYPSVDGIDTQYINNLQTPVGYKDYDQVFDVAIENIGVVWAEISKDLSGGGSSKILLSGNWNLDTGESESGKLVFWG